MRSNSLLATSTFCIIQGLSPAVAGKVETSSSDVYSITSPVSGYTLPQSETSPVKGYTDMCKREESSRFCNSSYTNPIPIIVYKQLKHSLERAFKYIKDGMVYDNDSIIYSKQESDTSSIMGNQLTNTTQSTETITEYWKNILPAIQRGEKPRGDCEDFVMATLDYLHIHNNIPDKAMRMTVVKTPKTTTTGEYEKDKEGNIVYGEGHAVGLVFTDEGVVVIDNLSSEPFLATSSDLLKVFGHYYWQQIQSDTAPNKWILLEGKNIIFKRN